MGSQIGLMAFVIYALIEVVLHFFAERTITGHIFNLIEQYLLMDDSGPFPPYERKKVNLKIILIILPALLLTFTLVITSIILASSGHTNGAGLRLIILGVTGVLFLIGVAILWVELENGQVEVAAKTDES